MHHQLPGLAARAGDAIGQAGLEVLVGHPDDRLLSIAMDDTGWQVEHRLQQLLAAILAEGYQDPLPVVISCRLQTMQGIGYGSACTCLKFGTSQEQLHGH
jgi:hypothetical protein